MTLARTLLLDQMWKIFGISHFSKIFPPVAGGKCSFFTFYLWSVMRKECLSFSSKKTVPTLFVLLGSQSHEPLTLTCQPLSEVEEGMVTKVICGTGWSPIPVLYPAHKPSSRSFFFDGFDGLLSSSRPCSALPAGDCKLLQSNTTYWSPCFLLWAPGSLLTPFVPL